MIYIKEKEKCSGCSACYNICPKRCIEMVEDHEGFLYPSVNEDVCIHCNQCDNVCPIINENKTDKDIMAYAAYSRNDDVRTSSSSGGVFTEIASQILKNNGIVYGALFDSDFLLCHSSIDSIGDLPKLQGSKYLQSNLNSTFSSIKTNLDSGKLVYFSGTPCQVEGLLNYLKKDYCNLFTQDIVCHGVPSGKVWKRYFDYVKKNNNSDVSTISFREKTFGWKNFAMFFLFENGKSYKKKLTEDLYMRGFLNNIFLRPSCYSCSFKSLNRRSDITLADFWGVEKVCPEMYKEDGVSLVLLNSEKGKTLWKEIRNNVECKKVELSDAVKFNSAATKSVPYNDKRELFFERLKTMEFDNALNSVLPKETIVRKLLRKVKRRIEKLIK